jgi:hypothetical protein
MIDPTDALPVLKLVALPLITFVAGKAFGAKRERRAVVVRRRAEEQVDAYDRTVKDFELLQRNAAVRLRVLERKMDPEGIPLSPAEHQKDEETAQTSRGSYERLRHTASDGPVALSKKAIDVIWEFLAEIESPERSDTEGFYYEEAGLTDKYLRDFEDRRKVELGDMRPTMYWIKRKGRAAQRLIRIWRYRIDQYRTRRRWKREGVIRRR